MWIIYKRENIDKVMQVVNKFIIATITLLTKG